MAEVVAAINIKMVAQEVQAAAVREVHPPVVRPVVHLQQRLVSEMWGVVPEVR
jgi:hypothetical protein